MCGRYELNLSKKDILEYYDIEKTDVPIEENSEIFPTNWVPSVLPDKKIDLMKWGLAEPWAKQPIINSRIETVDEKKTTKKAFHSQRCIMPASAFFEWNEVKTRVRFTSSDSKVQSLAAVYKFYENDEGNVYAGFSLLTMAANEQMKPVHDRMPVVLPKQLVAPYLDMSSPVLDLKEELLRIDPTWEVTEIPK